MNIVAVPYVVAMRDANIAADDYVDPSWNTWWVIHSALDAQPPPADRVPNWREIWEQIAGGREWPTIRPREWWLIGSRRIAKTREEARRGAWACVTFDPKLLTRGERGVYGFTAPDRTQAAIAFEYACAFVEQSPMLAAMIDDKTKTELRFKNRTAMRVATASFRTQRGKTSIGESDDEAAFMHDAEASANPFSAILAAQRPAMATIPTAQLAVATTPRGRNDTVFRTFERYFGQSDPRVLVLRADHSHNPTLDPAVVQAALEADEFAARAEFFAEFRTDVETFLSRDLVMRNVVENRGDIPPHAGARVYWFTDPASGSGADSYTLAGVMQHGDRIVTVALRERKPPFSPDDVTAEYATLIKSYGSHSVRGDRWALGWPKDRFKAHGVSYEVSEKSKSEIYTFTLPLLTAGKIELPDHPRLIAQLCALERRVARGGRDSIDHPPRGHDDICNALLGAAHLVQNRPRGGGPVVYLEAGSNQRSIQRNPHLTPLPAYQPRPWTYGSPQPCPLPASQRRTRGG